jgi:hypothetical protein
MLGKKGDNTGTETVSGETAGQSQDQGQAKARDENTGNAATEDPFGIGGGEENDDLPF